MSLDHDQIDILRIYIGKTQSATIHNLNVAQSYFSNTSYAHILSRLTNLVSNMSNYEFERWYKKITSKPMV